MGRPSLETSWSEGPGPAVGRSSNLEDDYTYVNGDPMNLVDPTGHKACADEACYQFIIPQSGSHELRGHSSERLDSTARPSRNGVRLFPGRQDRLRYGPCRVPDGNPVFHAGST